MSKPRSSAIVPPSTASAATTGGATLDDDHLNPQVNVSCLDFLLIELVPTVQRITEQTLARDQALLDAWQRSKILTAGGGRKGDEHVLSLTDDAHPDQQQEQQESAKTRKSSSRAPNGVYENGLDASPGLMPDESTRSAVFWRLDGLGYRVGQGLVER